jgi:hypothetical protein
MELERTANHHTSLTRDLPLGPVDDSTLFARHDPMRLPDAHLRRADATVGAVSQERNLFDRSKNNDGHSEWYQRSKSRRAVVPQHNTKAPERVRQEEEILFNEDTSRRTGLSLTKSKPYPMPSVPAVSPTVEVAEDSSLDEASSWDELSGSEDEVSERVHPRRYARPALRAPGQILPAVSPTVEDYTSDETWEDNKRRGNPGTASRKTSLVLVCETVSRDGTSSENAKISSLVKMAMEPHVRRGGGRGYDLSLRPQPRDQIHLRDEYEDVPRQAQAPPLNHTKSAPDQIHLPGEPMQRRAYSTQEPKEEEFLRPPPIRRGTRVNTSQLHANAKRERERESNRKPQKASELRKTENLESLPSQLHANAKRERRNIRRPNPGPLYGLIPSP